MKPIPLGATVRQIVIPIEGIVIERHFNESHSEMEYHIDSGAGEARWFLESNITEIAAPVGEAA